MRILVGWDNAEEAQLITLYLNVENNAIFVATRAEELLALAGSQAEWDVILLSTTLPDTELALGLCRRLRELHPDCPLVGGCHHADVYQMARFLTNGMQHYFIRDPKQDFLFLLHATVTNVVEGVHAERERQIAKFLRDEIASVRKLQESLIPPEILCPKGYQIRARYESSQIQILGGHPVILAGGDYYDVIRLDEHSLILVVGDASGHGMRACMSIMIMQALARMIHDQRYRDPRHFMEHVNSRLFSRQPQALLHDQPDPAWFVAEINRRLCEQSILEEIGGFITLLYGVLNTERHEFRWTSAGHPPPLLHQLESDHIEPVGNHELAGVPLGLMAGESYQTQSCFIPPNSRLVIYSDGLAEAFPVDERTPHREYGLPGIGHTLRRMKHQPLASALDALFADSLAFTTGHGRHDDTTIVLIERT